MTIPASTGPTGCNRYSNEVTTPKLPPPPRRPQNRSGFSSALAVKNSPSAVTMSAESRLSQLSPCLPIAQPSPPPRVSPAMPVVETTPPVVARPKACVSRLNSPQVRPGSARAVRLTGSTLTLFIGDRSIIRPPSHTALPVMLWPPPFTDTSMPWARAKRTAAMTSATPALIARCAGVADVMAAVRFARAHGILVSVKGGGHNITGNAVCEGGLMIDLSPMKSVRVDPVKRTARAEPGLTWGEFNRETQAFGLATTGGVVSTTGIAGLTLGGGLGWAMGKHGLSCDNLLSADIVTADGQLLTASADQNPDLFWGLRGGGGDVGLVTSFEY